MEFFGIDKKEAEIRISETPLPFKDTSEDESDDYETESDHGLQD